MASTAQLFAPRHLGALGVALALALTGVIALTASPADAATPGYLGAHAPLEWNGTTYDSPPPGGGGSGAGYVSETGEISFVDTPPFGSISGISGNANFHVALATYDVGGGPEFSTVYISDQWLQDAPGGPYPATCAGADAAVFDGGPACQAFKADILTANGAGNDFSYTGTSGFVDASNNPTTDASTVEDEPAVSWPHYQGGASPFAFGGADYSGDFYGGTDPGSMWLPAGSAPLAATDQAVALPLIPTVGSGGEIYPVHIALLEAGPTRISMAIDGAHFSLFDPMNPFSADCAGFQDFLTMVGQGGIDCVAFRTNVWAPPSTVGEQYTCASDWYTGWTDQNGDAIDPANEPTTVTGFEPPALTPIGVDTGPGVCVASTPPGPPPTPPTTTPGGGGNAGGGTGAGGTAGTGSAPTLPATGATTPALLLGALALIAAGTTVALTTRRHTRPRTVGPDTSHTGA